MDRSKQCTFGLRPSKASEVQRCIGVVRRPSLKLQLEDPCRNCGTITAGAPTLAAVIFPASKRRFKMLLLTLITSGSYSPLLLKDSKRTNLKNTRLHAHRRYDHESSSSPPCIAVIIIRPRRRHQRRNHICGNRRHASTHLQIHKQLSFPMVSSQSSKMAAFADLQMPKSPKSWQGHTICGLLPPAVCVLRTNPAPATVWLAFRTHGVLEASGVGLGWTDRCALIGWGLRWQKLQTAM